MPTSFYYNGKTTFTPGVYTTVNTSNLNTVNAQASGIVLVIGQATGGTPYTAVQKRSDFPTFTTPQQMQQYFGSGDLVEAANFLFAPSNDPAILGGAQQVIALNVIPSTPASVTLKSGSASALSLNSKAYGPTGNQLSVSVSAGTVAGTMLVISQGAISETYDNLGSGTGGFATLGAPSNAYTAAFDTSGNLTVAQSGTTLFAVTAQQTVGQLQAAALAAGLTFTFSDPTKSSLTMAQLDHPAGSIALQTAGLTLSANLYAISNAVNNNSQLATAAPLLSGTGAPSAVTGVYFAGGSTSTPTFSDWQNCLNLGELVRVNTVVCLTSNQAVNTATDAHCAYMCGLGQSERDCFVGLQNPTQTSYATLAQAQQQSLALNSRHTRCLPQGFGDYNTTGVLTTFAPHFYAAKAAGMQAGAGVGVPLTHKTCNGVAIYQDPSWSPVLNADQAIQSGLMIFQYADNIGIRCVRNVTSYQTDANLAFSEGSVNQALDYATYGLRFALQQFVGQVNFTGSINAIQAAATATLQQMQGNGIITAFQTPVVTQNNDQAVVAVAIAPVLPINFIPVTLNVVSPALLAA